MKPSERYFRQVKRHIPIGGLRKKEFLCNLQESLAAYAAKNPSALLSDYYAHFGKPEDIAVSFLSEKQNNQTTTSNFPCNFNFTVSNMNRFN